MILFLLWSGVSVWPMFIMGFTLTCRLLRWSSILRKCNDTCLTATAQEPKVPFLTIPLDPPPSTSLERRNCFSWINQRPGTRVDSWASSAPLVISTARSERSLNSLMGPFPPTVSLGSCIGFDDHALCFQCRRNTIMPSTRTTKAAMQAATIISMATGGLPVGVGLHCLSSPILPAEPSNISTLDALLLIHESPHNVWWNSEAFKNTVASAGLGFGLGLEWVRATV